MKRTSNTGSPSTTWEWKKVRVRRPPEAHSDSAAPRHRWRRFPTRDARKPITVTVWLRGGAEAWVAVKGRGETNFYTGDTALVDVLFDINNVVSR